MTLSYAPETIIKLHAASKRASRVLVRDENALTAARRLHMMSLRPVVLNFASARNPGGGWNVDGVHGQEEELCRHTTLAEHLLAPEAAAFYTHHATVGPMNTSWVLYSDDVAVRSEPEWTCAFITCAAPNAKELFRYGREADELRRIEGEIAAAFAERTRRVLAIAAAHGHLSVVLGAWGCGNFGNDPHVVAGAFADALHGPFANVFDEVVVAVTSEPWVRRTFERAMGRN